MNFNSFSLLKKLVISTIPIVVGVSFVVVTIYHMSHKNDVEGVRAVNMIDYVNSAELAMVKMSESLRGYLIDPSNEKEFENKKAADEEFAKNSSKLAELVSDSPEIAALNKKMADYDASDLDKVEDKVGELIKERSPDAAKYYTQTYMPARAIQAENFRQLKELVKAKSASIVDEINSRRVNDGLRSIALLIGSILIGIGVMMWVIILTMKRVSNIVVSLDKSSAALKVTSSQIATSSDHFSKATTEQAASLQETSSAIEEMNSMVNKNSDNAQNTASTSIASQQKAEHGKKVVEKMIKSMNEINDSNNAIMKEINNSNTQISEIVKVIQEIGSKTKVINDIVFQLKLLSFNASVEAARAGEHGKGFAVVAEEVGNLASMSGHAAKEISHMLESSIQKVENIVRDTKTNVEVLITEGKGKLDAGTEVARECDEVLNEIVRNVASVAQMANEISSASKEQATGVNEITKAINQLDAVTQQNANSSQESANAAENLFTQAESLKTVVDELVTTINGSNAKIAA